MTCHDLAERLAELRPELSADDIARLCVLILSTCQEPDRLIDDEYLNAQWKHANFRLEAATDQHAAVAAELERICGDTPIEFTPDQLWVLVRAVKAQSQLLELYTDQPALA